MTGKLYQHWPVYILLGVGMFFPGYVIMKGNIHDKQSKTKDANKEVKE
jgi:hypothetical protein